MNGHMSSGWMNVSLMLVVLLVGYMLLAEPTKSMMTLAFSLALRRLIHSPFGATLWEKRKALFVRHTKNAEP